jgi:hypothetical protein
VRQRLLQVRFAAVLAASALFALPARDARAGSCVPPDLLETMPPDNAQNVPTNAILFARYASTAQYARESVPLEHVGAETTTPTATFDPTEGTLRITPPAPLVTGDSYVVHWPSLGDGNTATLGTQLDQHFAVGLTEDLKAPTFQGLTSITWDASHTNDSCSNSVAERFVFDLGLGAADDDGGRDSLTLIVFQTAGPTVTAAAPTPVLLQRLPAVGKSVRVTTLVDSGVGHVCFAAIVRDLTLKVSTSGPETCVDTVRPPFFYGCAAAPVGGGGSRGLLVLALALPLVVARRKGRRARGSGGA